VLTRLRILVHGGTHLLGSSNTDRQAKEICRRAECARTELIASNALATGIQYARLHTLVVYFFLARSLSLSLCLFLSLPSSPARRGGSRRLVQMRTRTVLITSNALAAEIYYTHLHTLGVWCQRAPMRFSAFCIDRAEHLKTQLRTVVYQYFDN